MIYENNFLVRETAFDYFSVQKNIEQTKLIQTVLKKDSLSGLELYDWVCFWSHAFVIFFDSFRPDSGSNFPFRIFEVTLDRNIMFEVLHEIDTILTFIYLLCN